MACPTCGHAWHWLSRGIMPIVEFCPRCGTINGKFFGEDDPIVPKLVGQCRAFEGGLRREPRSVHSAAEVWGGLQVTWHSLGIAESINVPDKRPT